MPNWRKPEVEEDEEKGEVSECRLTPPNEDESEEDVVARDEPTEQERRWLRRFRRRASEWRITCTMRAWLPA